LVIRSIRFFHITCIYTLHYTDHFSSSIVTDSNGGRSLSLGFRTVHMPHVLQPLTLSPCFSSYSLGTDHTENITPNSSYIRSGLSSYIVASDCHCSNRAENTTLLIVLHAPLPNNSRCTVVYFAVIA
jgi:hypothetical protein